MDRQRHRRKLDRFKSREQNLVHYVTAVNYDRVPVFRSDHACQLLIDALVTTRMKDQFRLIGYVIMPDHFHMLANPLGLDITIVTGRLKGRAASSILQWLRYEGHWSSLKKLALAAKLQSGQTHAVWMKEFSSIDIWSHKFIRQKLNYVHLNPVRAGLCDHPAKWRWSSYHAYLPHEPGAVPIEIDWRWTWSEEEFHTSGADKSAI